MEYYTAILQVLLHIAWMKLTSILANEARNKRVHVYDFIYTNFETSESWFMRSQVRILVITGGKLVTGRGQKRDFLVKFYLLIWVLLHAVAQMVKKKCIEFMICISSQLIAQENQKLMNFTCTSFKESNRSTRFKSSISLLPIPLHSLCNNNTPQIMFQLFLVDSFAFDLYRTT